MRAVERPSTPAQHQLVAVLVQDVGHGSPVRVNAQPRVVSSVTLLPTRCRAWMKSSSYRRIQRAVVLMQAFGAPKARRQDMAKQLLNERSQHLSLVY